MFPVRVNQPAEKPNCQIVVILLDPKPHSYSKRKRVDVAHAVDLFIPLLNIRLVDTKCVDPETHAKSSGRFSPDSLQEFFEIGPHFNDETIQYYQFGVFWIAPSV